MGIKVTANGRFLSDEQGKPFFWLGDTAWELFHRLDRDETVRYLADRASKGFTVVQAACLAEMDGLRVPNRYGRLPFIDGDPTQPDTSGGYCYWSHVDWVIETAAGFGLRVAMLPTWGCNVSSDCFNGVVNGVFNPQNAGVYGEFIGRRHGARKNVVWVLGGDRLPASDEAQAVWRNMAGGIAIGANGSGDSSNLLMTYHPPGPSHSSTYLHNEPWLHLNMVQSGHAERDVAAWDMVSADWERLPAKPVLDGEINYEDLPVGFTNETGDRFNAHDVRKQAYRTVFAGACGVTYGHNSIWQFFVPGLPWWIRPNMTWMDALNRPGAGEMLHLRRLMESRPYETRIPDQGMVEWRDDKPSNHIRATRDSAGSYAFVYIPDSGMEFTVDTTRLSGTALRAWWYCPRTGISKLIGSYPVGGGISFITPWDEGDRVLVLDDESMGYGAPGI